MTGVQTCALPILDYSKYQDKESKAWKELLDYIDEVATEEIEDFDPRIGIGFENFKEIIVLPKSIKKLKKVKRMWLYGSSLKLIPPEIGEMESLELFDPYTSYDLKWFPYEITNCKKLRASRISTRALLGNYKNRKPFPSLEENLIKYSGEQLNCSICKKEISYSTTNQMWITINVGTDPIPMLINLCSNECGEKLPLGEGNYLEFAHKGGKDLKQPPQAWNTGVKQNEEDVDFMRNVMTEYFTKLRNENKA